MLLPVEVEHFIELSFPVGQVEQALLRSPETWVLKLARQAGRRGELLLSEVGFGPSGRGLRKDVLIELARPYRLASKTVLPITWTATGPRRLFPEMEADIGVLALDANRTQLSFEGRYPAALGVGGARHRPRAFAPRGGGHSPRLHGSPGAGLGVAGSWRDHSAAYPSSRGLNRRRLVDCTSRNQCAPGSRSYAVPIVWTRTASWSFDSLCSSSGR